MMTDDLHDRLAALTRAAAHDGDGESEPFRVSDGALKGFAPAAFGALDALAQTITRHRNERRAQAQRQSRQTFGIELGAGSAKLFAKQWTQDAPAQTIVDVKLRLVRRTGTPDTERAYRNQIEHILAAFATHTRTDHLVPPQHIAFDAPERLRAACPPDTDVLYVYGTQGPRESTRSSGPLFPRTLRLLTGDEEARLMFDAIVPPESRHPGAMSIEIGTGSTELALIDAAGRQQTITFQLGAARQDPLAAIAKAIATTDITPAVDHLEGPASSAATFLTESRRTNLRLYINPNKQSAGMRDQTRPAPGTPIPLATIARYATDQTAPKAKILATLAQAFALTTIHEGTKGGLKKAMAQFVGRALVKRA